MCGLFGWFEKEKGSLKLDQKKLLTAVLGVKSQVRGTDSWGVFTVWTDKHKRWYRPHRGVGAFKTASRKKLWADIPTAEFVMGHTRMKTHGLAKIKNAHPFTCQEWHMAHNGVLSEGTYLKETLIMPEGETDSEAFLCWVVSKKKGIEGFMETNTSENAFEVYNSKTNELFLISRGREIYAADMGDVVVWSSEKVITETSVHIGLGRQVEAKALPEHSIVKLTSGGFETVYTGTPTLRQTEFEGYNAYGGFARYDRLNWNDSYEEDQLAKIEEIYTARDIAQGKVKEEILKD